MMTAKLEFEFKLDQQSPRWWEGVLDRQSQINKFIKEHGKGFYKVTTFDDQEFHVHLSDAKDAVLNLRTYSMYDFIPVQKLRAIEKDSKAEKTHEALVTEDERDQYLKKWHNAGQRWVPRGTTGVIST